MTYKFLANFSLVLIIIYLISLSFRLLTGSGLLDRWGSPVGGDFVCYWLASKLAATGEAAALYNSPRLGAAATAFFGVPLSYPWPYPPTFLLLILPLSQLPYLVSLAAWLLPALGGYLWLVHRFAPSPLTVWLTLAFGGTFQNLAHGQNGFLSAVLLGAGLLLVDSSPVAGGLVLGLLTYKPHLAVLIFVALMAGRRWRAWLAAVAAALSLALASALVLGLEVWPAFIKSIPLTMKQLASGILPLENLVTAAGAVMLLGGSLSLALALQGVVMLGAAWAVVRVWSRGASLAMRGSVLGLGTLLFSPHVFVYDLTLLALPLAWLSWEGFRKGWLAKEQFLLTGCWALPLVAPVLAKLTRVQLAPAALALLLLLALKREKNPGPKAES